MAYAYVNGYTKGVSETLFGSSNTASAAMYLTFMLRALEYEEGYGKDFRWDDPFTFAWSRDLLPDEVDTTHFERADAVLVSWAALAVPMNMGNAALAELMVMDGVFTQSQLDRAWDIVNNGSSDRVNGVKTGSYVCAIDADGYEYNAAYRPVLTLLPDGTFSLLVNMGGRMSTCSGTWQTSINDSNETLVFLIITQPSGFDPATNRYILSVYNDMMYVEDGSIGITPVYSEFHYSPGYVPIQDTGAAKQPSNSGKDSDECGIKLEGDNAASTNLRDTVLLDPLGTLEKLDLVSVPTRPDETTELLAGIRSGEKKKGYNTTLIGSLTEIYRYWASREQLEQYPVTCSIFMTLQ